MLKKSSRKDLVAFAIRHLKDHLNEWNYRFNIPFVGKLAARSNICTQINEYILSFFLSETPKYPFGYLYVYDDREDNSFDIFLSEEDKKEVTNLLQKCEKHAEMDEPGKEESQIKEILENIKD
jgi:hypothetical protein